MNKYIIIFNKDNVLIQEVECEALPLDLTFAPFWQREGYESLRAYNEQMKKTTPWRVITDTLFQSPVNKRFKILLPNKMAGESYYDFAVFDTEADALARANLTIRASFERGIVFDEDAFLKKMSTVQTVKLSKE